MTSTMNDVCCSWFAIDNGRRRQCVPWTESVAEDKFAEDGAKDDGATYNSITGNGALDDE